MVQGLPESGGYSVEGTKGENWDNSNSIINKNIIEKENKWKERTQAN